LLDVKTGFLVQPKNSAALFEKMLILLEDKRLSESMGKASRKRAENYFYCDTIGGKLQFF
jgi:glycosyltransferase involved in cell wall biosynthesis